MIWFVQIDGHADIFVVLLLLGEINAPFSVDNVTKGNNKDSCCPAEVLFFVHRVLFSHIVYSAFMLCE